MVKSTSEVMLGSLPNFWKISTAFLGGKYRKVRVREGMRGVYIRLTCNQSVNGSSRRSPSQCRTMALDIVKQYISLLSEFFMFSDAAIVTSPSLGNSPTPPLLPRDSNTLTTMHHLMKILGEIQDTVTEITGMDISSEASSSLRGVLESARWKFDDTLVHAWLRGKLIDALDQHSWCTDRCDADTNIFYHLESWRGSNTDPHTTVYLSHVQLFQRQVTTGAFKIAGGVDLTSAAASTSRLIKQNPVPPMFVSRIAKAFLDTLYAFLDGLVHLASDESPRLADPKSAPEVNATNEPNPLELLNLENPVSSFRDFALRILTLSL